MSAGTVECRNEESACTPTQRIPLSREYTTAAILAALGLMTIPIDLAITRWIGPDQVFGEVEVFLNRIEPYGHGYGVLMISLTLCFIGQIRFRTVLMLLGCAIGSGLTADLVKLFVCRFRPKYVLIEDTDQFLTGFQSFGEFHGLAHLLESSHRSFPSAHTATAFGFIRCTRCALSARLALAVWSCRSRGDSARRDGLSLCKRRFGRYRDRACRRYDAVPSISTSGCGARGRHNAPPCGETA